MEKSKLTQNFILLIIMQICVVLLLPLWFIVAAISLMAFDGGYNTEAIIFVSVTWAYPLVSLIFSVLAWVYYKKAKQKKSIICISVPLIYVSVYFLVLFFLP